MKQSDLFSIIIIATIGTLASFFIVNSFLGDPNLKSENIKTVDAITAELVKPDSELFNPASINPTVEVFVGDCEDADRNGILSREELIMCGKITEEDDQVKDKNLFVCADGSFTDDLNKCPENVVEEAGGQ